MPAGSRWRLLGIRTVEQLRSHPLRGALFESWVVAEAYKALLNRGEPRRLCFYRSRDGAEADLLIDHPSGLTLLEAKAGATPAGNLFDGARRVRRQLEEQASCQLAVVYGGQEAQTRSIGRIIPWAKLHLEV